MNICVLYLVLFLGCSSATNITTLYQEISESKVIPDNMSLKYTEYTQNNTRNYAPIYLFCGISLEVLLSNRLAHMLSMAPGLYGVALVGATLTALVGSEYVPDNSLINEIELTSVPGCNVKSYSDRPHEYDLFMRTQPEYFYDTITLCEYELYSQFRYLGNTIITGPTKLYKDKKLIYQSD